MTFEFDYLKSKKNRCQENGPDGRDGRDHESIAVMNMLKRDRFELLSAYLDGEVTAAERREVEEWLRKDPEVQHLYARLLCLRQNMRTLPTPPAQQPVEQTVEQVLARVNRRPKLAVVWGGTAIAALFVGALSGLLSSPQALKMAKPLPSKPLMVAINTPVVAIPKTAVAAPAPPNPQIWSPQPQVKENVN